MVVLVNCRVGLETFYNVEKGLLRVLVVEGGRGINYWWKVKRVLILLEMGERTCV